MVSVGLNVGLDEEEGTAVSGTVVGETVEKFFVGKAVGPLVGVKVGAFVSDNTVGLVVGKAVGPLVGVKVGTFVGDTVGAIVGDKVGGRDGALVGSSWTSINGQKTSFRMT